VISHLFEAKYSGFIFSAYAITFVVLASLIIWAVSTSRTRRRMLARLEANALKSASETQNDAE